MEGIRCDLSSRGAWERLRHATRPLVSESSAVGLFGTGQLSETKTTKSGEVGYPATWTSTPV